FVLARLNGDRLLRLGSVAQLNDAGALRRMAASLAAVCMLCSASAIALETTLSYIGLGIQPPIPSWGNMLSNAQQYFFSAPWLVFFPGICIFITLMSFNMIGDGLRDAFDPRMTRR